MKILRTSGTVKLANRSTASLLGECKLTITIDDRTFHNVLFYVLSPLAADVIIGTDIMERFKSVTFHFGGKQAAIHSNAVSHLEEYPAIFKFLTPDCHPIAVKSRSYSKSDKQFFEKEVQRLLSLNKIHKSKSPWRAQPLRVKKNNHSDDDKDRMVIDYSMTINKFTLLDAFPLPKVSDIVNAVAKFNVLSTCGLSEL